MGTVIRSKMHSKLPVGEVSSWPKDISGQIIKWQVRGGPGYYTWSVLKGGPSNFVKNFPRQGLSGHRHGMFELFFFFFFLSPRSLNLAIYKELLLTSNWDFPRSAGTLIFMGWSRRSVLLFFFLFSFSLQNSNQWEATVASMYKSEALSYKETSQHVLVNL